MKERTKSTSRRLRQVLAWMLAIALVFSLNVGTFSLTAQAADGCSCTDCDCSTGTCTCEDCTSDSCVCKTADEEETPTPSKTCQCTEEGEDSCTCTGDGESECTCVAEVTNGETTTCYSSLSDAFSNVASGGTVTVMADCEITASIAIGSGKTSESYTLDLNGHTVTRTDSYYILLTGTSNTLTICDSGTGGTLAGTGSKLVFQYGSSSSGCKVKLESGIISAVGGTPVGVNGSSNTFEMSGGSLTESCSSTSSGSLYVYTNNTATISGGTITTTDTTKSYGIQAEASATVNVSGGTITATGTTAYGIYGYATVNVSGGTITASGTTAYGIYAKANANVTVSGGTIEATSASSRGICADLSATVAVSNGTITASGTNSNGLYATSGSVIKISGGTFSGTTFAVQSLSVESDSAISGGTFTSSSATGCVIGKVAENYGIYYGAAYDADATGLHAVCVSSSSLSRETGAEYYYEAKTLNTGSSVNYADQYFADADLALSMYGTNVNYPLCLWAAPDTYEKSISTTTIAVYLIYMNSTIQTDTESKLASGIRNYNIKSESYSYTSQPESSTGMKYSLALDSSLKGAFVITSESNTEGTGYSTLALAVAALKDGDTLTFNAAGSSCNTKTISANNVTIDLNGFDATAYKWTITGSLTLTDSSKDYEPGTFGNSSNCIFIVAKGGSLTVKDGVTVKCTSSSSGKYPIQIGSGTAGENGGTVTLENCTVTGGYAAIAMWGPGSADYTASSLTATNATISGSSFGVSTNGTSTLGYNNITLEGCTVTSSASDGVAMYLPAVSSETTVENCTITGSTGIEIRAGKLTVNGGTITGNGAYSITANGGGSTASGVGIAVSQHTTNQAIEVSITDGTISGACALYEGDLQDKTAQESISVSISGGIFNATSSDLDVVVKAITAATMEISGGYFNKVVDATYCATYGDDNTSTYTPDAVATYTVDGYENLFYSVHKHGTDGVVTTEAKDATCTETGIRTTYYYCKYCDTYYSDEAMDTVLEDTSSYVTSALGHSYTSAVTTAATCTETGVMTYTCTACGDEYTTVIAATGHTAVTDAAVAATCTSTGLTVGYHCSVCNTVLTAQTTTAALGHSYDEGVVTKEAEVGVNGVMTYTCTRCSETYTKPIAALSEEAEEETQTTVFASTSDEEIASVSITIDAVDDLLSDAEQAIIDAGGSVELVLEVATKDEETVAEAEVTAIETAIASTETEVSADDVVAISYLDINLTKYITTATGTLSSNEAVTDVGSMVTITVSVPQSLLDAAAELENSKYTVIRVHDGVATVLETTYDAETETITFQTDQFSTYAIVCESVKAAEIKTVDGVKYEITSDGTVTVYGLTKKTKASATKVVIPATVKIDGVTYKVTAIGEKAFKGAKLLKKVTIGKNVTTIGDRAFAKCSSLKKVIVKGKLSSVGKKVFNKVKNTVTVTAKNKTLKKKYTTYFAKTGAKKVVVKKK